MSSMRHPIPRPFGPYTNPDIPFIVRCALNPAASVDAADFRRVTRNASKKSDEHRLTFAPENTTSPGFPELRRATNRFTAFVFKILSAFFATPRDTRFSPVPWRPGIYVYGLPEAFSFARIASHLLRYSALIGMCVIFTKGQASCRRFRSTGSTST